MTEIHDTHQSSLVVLVQNIIDQVNLQQESQGISYKRALELVTRYTSQHVTKNEPILRRNAIFTLLQSNLIRCEHIADNRNIKEYVAQATDEELKDNIIFHATAIGFANSTGFDPAFNDLDAHSITMLQFIARSRARGTTGAEISKEMSLSFSMTHIFIVRLIQAGLIVRRHHTAEYNSPMYCLQRYAKPSTGTKYDILADELVHVLQLVPNCCLAIKDYSLLCRLSKAEHNHFVNRVVARFRDEPDFPVQLQRVKINSESDQLKNSSSLDVYSYARSGELSDESDADSALNKTVKTPKSQNKKRRKSRGKTEESCYLFAYVLSEERTRDIRSVDKMVNSLRKSEPFSLGKMCEYVPAKPKTTFRHVESNVSTQSDPAVVRELLAPSILLRAALLYYPKSFSAPEITASAGIAARKAGDLCKSLCKGGWIMSESKSSARTTVNMYIASPKLRKLNDALLLYDSRQGEAFVRGEQPISATAETDKTSTNQIPVSSDSSSLSSIIQSMSSSEASAAAISNLPTPALLISKQKKSEESIPKELSQGQTVLSEVHPVENVQLKKTCEDLVHNKQELLKEIVKFAIKQWKVVHNSHIARLASAFTEHYTGHSIDRRTSKRQCKILAKAGHCRIFQQRVNPPSRTTHVLLVAPNDIADDDEQLLHVKNVYAQRPISFNSDYDHSDFYLSQLRLGIPPDHLKSPTNDKTIVKTSGNDQAMSGSTPSRVSRTLRLAVMSDGTSSPLTSNQIPHQPFRNSSFTVSRLVRHVTFTDINKQRIFARHNISPLLFAHRLPANVRAAEFHLRIITYILENGSEQFTSKDDDHSWSIHLNDVIQNMSVLSFIRIFEPLNARLMHALHSAKLEEIVLKNPLMKDVHPATANLLFFNAISAGHVRALSKTMESVHLLYHPKQSDRRLKSKLSSSFYRFNLRKQVVLSRDLTHRIALHVDTVDNAINYWRVLYIRQYLKSHHPRMWYWAVTHLVPPDLSVHGMKYDATLDAWVVPPQHIHCIASCTGEINELNASILVAWAAIFQCLGMQRKSSSWSIPLSVPRGGPSLPKVQFDMEEWIIARDKEEVMKFGRKKEMMDSLAKLIMTDVSDTTSSSSDEDERRPLTRKRKNREQLKDHRKTKAKKQYASEIISTEATITAADVDENKKKHFTSENSSTGTTKIAAEVDEDKKEQNASLNISTGETKATSEIDEKSSTTMSLSQHLSLPASIRWYHYLNFYRTKSIAQCEKITDFADPTITKLPTSEMLLHNTMELGDSSFRPFKEWTHQDDNILIDAIAKTIVERSQRKKPAVGVTLSARERALLLPAFDRMWSLMSDTSHNSPQYTSRYNKLENDEQSSGSDTGGDEGMDETDDDDADSTTDELQHQFADQFERLPDQDPLGLTRNAYMRASILNSLTLHDWNHISNHVWTSPMACRMRILFLINTRASTLEQLKATIRGKRRRIGLESSTVPSCDAVDTSIEMDDENRNDGMERQKKQDSNDNIDFKVDAWHTISNECDRPIAQGVLSTFSDKHIAKYPSKSKVCSERSIEQDHSSDQHHSSCSDLDSTSNLIMKQHDIRRPATNISSTIVTHDYYPFRQTNLEQISFDFTNELLNDPNAILNYTLRLGCRTMLKRHFACDACKESDETTDKYTEDSSRLERTGLALLVRQDILRRASTYNKRPKGFTASQIVLNDLCWSPSQAHALSFHVDDVYSMEGLTTAKHERFELDSLLSVIPCNRQIDTYIKTDEKQDDLWRSLLPFLLSILGVNPNSLSMAVDRKTLMKSVEKWIDPVNSALLYNQGRDMSNRFVSTARKFGAIVDDIFEGSLLSVWSIQNAKDIPEKLPKSPSGTCSNIQHFTSINSSENFQGLPSILQGCLTHKLQSQSGNLSMPQILKYAVKQCIDMKIDNPTIAGHRGFMCKIPEIHHNTDHQDHLNSPSSASTVPYSNTLIQTSDKSPSIVDTTSGSTSSASQMHLRESFTSQESIWSLSPTICDSNIPSSIPMSWRTSCRACMLRIKGTVMAMMVNVVHSHPGITEDELSSKLKVLAPLEIRILTNELISNGILRAVQPSFKFQTPFPSITLSSRALFVNSNPLIRLSAYVYDETENDEENESD